MDIKKANNYIGLVCDIGMKDIAGYKSIDGKIEKGPDGYLKVYDLENVNDFQLVDLKNIRVIAEKEDHIF